MSHNINIHHITRVEGHGNIVLNIKEGRIEELRLEIVESPRFFELMLIGRHISEAPHITSRICGICAVSHATASLKGCESALGIIPATAVTLLRKILVHAELLQSHILHLYLLVAPDFFNAGSVIPLARSHPEVVKRGLRLKKTANEICRILVGRHVHPISMTIGGFTKAPSKKDLSEVRRIIEDAIPDMDETVNLFAGIQSPEFSRETRYCSLKDDEEYALYGGNLYSKENNNPPLTKGGHGGVFSGATNGMDPSAYREFITEDVIEYSTAKHVKSGGQSIMVGALARLNNNYDQISTEAKEAAKRLGLTFPCTNSFMNNAAQLIECVHSLYDSFRLLDLLSADSTSTLAGDVVVKEGRGVGVVEAPRGTLYHEYETDDKGIITSVNCIIPTGQNLLNIENDIRAMVPAILDLPKIDIEKRLEMLVRAYDPCISCSTHFLEVKFID